MRVLLTGATGFIGYELARQLSTKGWRPRLAVRRPERGALLAKLDAELVQADLLSRASLDKAVRGVDAVIHLAARATFEHYDRLRPSIVDGSVALFEAAAAAGVRRFVYGSSLLVYGSGRRQVDRDTPVDPQLGYGRAKVEAETALARLAERSGTELCSLRYGHVYGARDLIFSKISRGLLIIPGTGSNLFSHLHVVDAARATIAALQSELTGPWPVADDRATTWEEFFETVREYYPRLRCMRTPAWLARLGTELARPVYALRSRPSLITPGAVIGWNLNIDVRPGLPWDELGLRPLYPTIREGVPAVLDDCVAFRWLHPVEDRVGW